MRLAYGKPVQPLTESVHELLTPDRVRSLEQVGRDVDAFISELKENLKAKFSDPKVAITERWSVYNSLRSFYKTCFNLAMQDPAEYSQIITKDQLFYLLDQLPFTVVEANAAKAKNDEDASA